VHPKGIFALTITTLGTLVASAASPSSCPSPLSRLRINQIPILVRKGLHFISQRSPLGFRTDHNVHEFSTYLSGRFSPLLLLSSAFPHPFFCFTSMSACHVVRPSDTLCSPFVQIVFPIFSSSLMSLFSCFELLAFSSRSHVSLHCHARLPHSFAHCSKDIAFLKISPMSFVPWPGPFSHRLESSFLPSSIFDGFAGYPYLASESLLVPRRLRTQLWLLLSGLFLIVLKFSSHRWWSPTPLTSALKMLLPSC